MANLAYHPKPRHPPCQTARQRATIDQWHATGAVGASVFGASLSAADAATAAVAPLPLMPGRREKTQEVVSRVPAPGEFMAGCRPCLPRFMKSSRPFEGRGLAGWKVLSVTGNDEGFPNRRPVLFFLVIPFVAFALFAVWIGSEDGADIVVALLTGVAAFALGFLLLVWLYRFARRRVENNATPKRWEYWLERNGWFFLPPAIGVGMWASQFGANEQWSTYLVVAVTSLLAGFFHGFVVLTPPEVPESYLETRDDL
jgi:hypothetical protein